MIEFKDWVATANFPQKPWMLFGKGPTFAKRSEVNLAEYNTMSLNHAVREQRVDVAHIIDIDVVEDLADALMSNCKWLLMPRRPHVGWNTSDLLTIEDWMLTLPVLRGLNDLGRLVVYDLEMSHNPDTSRPLAADEAVQAIYFSSEAALGLLGRMGAKTVRTLGIDGGRAYSNQFQDLAKRTLLRNGQQSFDLQFKQLENIAASYQMDYEPIVPPLRVFVGSEEAQIVAVKVLEYTIHKFASRPVRVQPMLNLPIPVPKDEKNQQRTGFSFYRFEIPKLAGYKGRALYLDADMQVFTDIAELWEIPFGDQKVLCTTQDIPEAWKEHNWAHAGRQFSVMLLDCDRLKHWDTNDIINSLDEGKFSYRDLMFHFCMVKPEEIEDRIPPEWNCLEHYEPGQSKLVHYTVIPSQPWAYEGNPIEHVWFKDYREAVRAGWVPREDVVYGVEKGHLRPLMLKMFDEEIEQLALQTTEKKPAAKPVNGHSGNGNGKYTNTFQRLQALVGEVHKARAEKALACEEARIAKKKATRADSDLMAANIKVIKAKAESTRLQSQLSQTLTAHKSEIDAYRARVGELEGSLHGLYRSKTWKLGRVFTKPVDLLRSR